MTTLGLNIIFLILLSTFSLFASEEVPESFKLERFETMVYPFLQKNCAECHSEDAIYPSGPTHSHSNLEFAYSSFERRLNIDRLQSSKMWRAGLDEHYCEEYGSLCENINDMIEEYKTVLSEYVNSIVDKRLEIEEEKSTREKLKVDFNSDLIVVPIFFKGEPTQLSVSFESHLYSEDNHYLLTSPRLIGSHGAFEIEGFNLVVNGKSQKRKNALSGLKRNFVFSLSDEQSILNSRNGEIKSSLFISPLNLLVKVTDTQDIYIEVDGFRKLSQVDTKLCSQRGLEYMKKHVVDNLTYEIRPLALWGHDLELCLKLESEINLSTLVRSPILSLGSALRRNFQDKYTLILGWLEHVQSEPVLKVPLE